MTIKISKLWAIRSACKAFTNSEKLTKFVYACKRNSEMLDSFLKEYDKKVDDLRYQYAAEKDGEVLRNRETGVVAIDKKHLRAFDQEVEKIIDQEVEMPEFYKAQNFVEIKNNINLLELFNGNMIDVEIESLIED